VDGVTSRCFHAISKRHTFYTPFRWCVQTAWQDLIATASEGSILDDTGEGKASILGAILTSQRLLLVSATLQVLAAMSIGSAEAGITSILWMGPALLFCTSENQVLPSRQTPSCILSTPVDIYSSFCCSNFTVPMLWCCWCKCTPQHERCR